MSNAFDTFVMSLASGDPPPSRRPMLCAVWHGLRGSWDAAHDLAQAQDDSEGAWVHAWLHRVEGDPDNAAYWYRRAGRQASDADTRAEGLEIARTLIGPAA